MQDTELEVRYEENGTTVCLANGLLRLEFDRATGRWLALMDASDGATLLHAGDLLSPLLLTVGGRTTATRNINQLFSVADAETIGLRWRLESCTFRPEGERGWLVVRLREG